MMLGLLLPFGGIAGAIHQMQLNGYTELGPQLVLAPKSQDMVYALSKLRSPRQEAGESNRPRWTAELSASQNRFQPSDTSQRATAPCNSAAAELDMTMGASELKTRGIRTSRDASLACIALQSYRSWIMQPGGLVVAS
jgi:hypothetical protein